MPATVARSWLFPKHRANPLFPPTKKRRFYRSNLPALRADVDRLAQKSAKSFLLPCRLRLLPPPQAACRRFPSVPAVPVKLPHTGATSGFVASGGYALGCVRKAAQTADTGAKVRNTLPVTAASLSRAVHTSFPCPPTNRERCASGHPRKSLLPDMPLLPHPPCPASRRPSSRP